MYVGRGTTRRPRSGRLRVFFALYPILADASTLGAAMPEQERLNLVIAPSVSSTLLLIATTLSTYKPWGRRTPR